MRTNVELNDALLAEAMVATGQRTKRATVDEALRTLVRLRDEVAWIRKFAGKAATNYRHLRGFGITIRKVPDPIIGTYCIEHGHSLLHDDRDFEPMREHLGLRVV